MAWDYDLVVIGAGSGGLVSAYLGAAVQARVALVEAERMGGDCLNTGCVPSKALLRSAQGLADMRRASALGLRCGDPGADFAAVMERVQATIAAIAPHDSVERYTGLGVECVAGRGVLLDGHTVQVGERTLRARAIVLATGARPLVPDLPGLAQATTWTSDTVWELRQLPERLAVLGAGPVGCELAQAFARLGARVTLVEQAPRLLPREDPDAAAVLSARLEAEGLELLFGHTALRFSAASASGEGEAGEAGGRGETVLHCQGPEAERAVPCDGALLAFGRQPNTAGLGLEAAGVELDERGRIRTDAHMRTTCSSVYAVGDVTSPLQLTHVASSQAATAVVHALFSPLQRPRREERIPWCTFTDPEVARLGLNEDEAQAQGLPHEVTRFELGGLDRAIAAGETEGFVKVLTPPGRDRILGVTIVGRHAGELLPEWVLALRHDLGLTAVLAATHAYPTLGEANQRLAGAWRREHVSPRAKAALARFHALRRGGWLGWLAVAALLLLGAAVGAALTLLLRGS